MSTKKKPVIPNQKAVKKSDAIQVSTPAFKLKPEEVQALNQAGQLIGEVEAKLIEITAQLHRERELRIANRAKLGREIAMSYGADLTKENWQFDLDRQILIQLNNVTVTPGKAEE
jgi:hypothetical protein